ncbi:MAG: hypothetical protein P4L84_11140 [Isosphaeraceae bacterium]|nr:hypothetical protein [Isosphaeraceae bacterium]
MRHRWIGDGGRVAAKLFGNVNAAGAQFQAAIEDAIATPGPPRSAPGEPPHVDTDRYRTSWSHETDGIDDIIVTRVSTDTPYAVDLEFGTVNMNARPHIQPTLIEEADDLARTVCRQ